MSYVHSKAGADSFGFSATARCQDLRSTQQWQLREVHNVVDGRWWVLPLLFSFHSAQLEVMLRLGRAALSCSRLWDWHDFQAKKAERKRLQTCEDDVPNQSKATEHDRLNQQNLLKSTNLSLFTCKLSTEKPSSSPKFIGDGKHMNFIDLADLAACTRCATFMLLAHCEGIVVGTIGLYLVPLACFVYFPLELDTELLNGSSINTREVSPSRLQVEPRNAELCFGSSCSKKTDVWQVLESSRLTENPWTPEWPRFALACASAGILSTAAWSSRPANQRQWQCHLMTSPLLLWGDVSLRAVSAMAAAVVFDAVARQSTENVPSVLAQANPGVCSREELSRTVEHVNTYNMMEQFPGNRNTFCEVVFHHRLHDTTDSRNAGFRPKTRAWPRKLCKGNCRTGRCELGELGESW